jgi:hypothetical protein
MKQTLEDERQALSTKLEEELEKQRSAQQVSKLLHVI